MVTLKRSVDLGRTVCQAADHPPVVGAAAAAPGAQSSAVSRNPRTVVWCGVAWRHARSYGEGRAVFPWRLRPPAAPKGAALVCGLVADVGVVRATVSKLHAGAIAVAAPDIDPVEATLARAASLAAAAAGRGRRRRTAVTGVVAGGRRRRTAVTGVAAAYGIAVRAERDAAVLVALAAKAQEVGIGPADAALAVIVVVAGFLEIGLG